MKQPTLNEELLRHEFELATTGMDFEGTDYGKSIKLLAYTYFCAGAFAAQSHLVSDTIFVPRTSEELVQAIQKTLGEMSNEID